MGFDYSAARQKGTMEAKIQYRLVEHSVYDFECGGPSESFYFDVDEGWINRHIKARLETQKPYIRSIEVYRRLISDWEEVTQL